MADVKLEIAKFAKFHKTTEFTEGLTMLELCQKTVIDFTVTYDLPSGKKVIRVIKEFRDDFFIRTYVPGREFEAYDRWFNLINDSGLFMMLCDYAHVRGE